MNPKTGICHYYKLQDHNQNEIKNISHLVSDKNGERLWIAVMGGGVFYMDLKTGKINRCDTFESGKEYQENYNALHIVGYPHCDAPAMVNYISVHTTVWDVWTYLQ